MNDWIYLNLFWNFKNSKALNIFWRNLESLVNFEYLEDIFLKMFKYLKY